VVVAIPLVVCALEQVFVARLVTGHGP
jgi:hypothetical protein